jgi:hypothetical protein
MWDDDLSAGPVFFHAATGLDNLVEPEGPAGLDMPGA